jgi:protein MpaA
MSRPQRLGKNINGYFGEKIEIAPLLTDCLAASRAHGWHVEEISPAPSITLLALTRLALGQAHSLNPAPSSSMPRIYMSTGIHGDEPAGPLAARQLLEENDWPADVSLWLFPCLNPTGFQLHRRENAEGIDLNRQYHQPAAEEVKAHIGWLKEQPVFDLCLCLHEDWESKGFYVYELNPDNRPSLAETIVSRVAEVCPVDPSGIIEGRPAHKGIIRPSVDPRSRPQWPESFYLLTHKTRLSYTLEAPSDFPISVRVSALVAGVRAAIHECVKRSAATAVPNGQVTTNSYQQNLIDE